MHFLDSSSLDSWRQLRSRPDQASRAKADNYAFDEQVSTERQETFEGFCGSMTDPVSLLRRHTDYVSERICEGNPPETFMRALKPTASGELDESQPLVRIESLERPMLALGIEFDELETALSGDSPESLAMADAFVQSWNDSRDNRPMFAAFRDSILTDADSNDWPHTLRDRLGLAHFQPGDGQRIPVAQMVYSVREVMHGVPLEATAFTTPTVLDSRPWEYFFPAPKGVQYGRAMALTDDGDEETLQAEVLHTRIDYKRQHMFRIGWIENRWEDVGVKRLPNHHLLLIRIASGRHDFGEEMP